jgi:phage/plasmid-like protein (TIGR03299 family)
MAHQVDESNGRANMAYVGAKPWHGYGQEMQPGQSIDQWKIAAGMDWQIKKSFVRYATDAKCENVPAYKDNLVLWRSDNKQPLSVVSAKYNVVQPGAVLEFFRDLTESMNWTLETAGCLYGGRKFWALAACGDTEEVTKEDWMKSYMLLSSNCDYSGRTILRPVAERVVCHNTLSIALKEHVMKEVAISHRSKFNPDEIKSQMGLTQENFLGFIKQCRELANKTITPDAADKFIGALLTETGLTKVEDYKTTSAYKQILNLFRSEAIGIGLAGEGSAWNMLNATTEFIDHATKARSDENRLASAWFGKGDTVKSKAFSMLMDA